MTDDTQNDDSAIDEIKKRIEEEKLRDQQEMEVANEDLQEQDEKDAKIEELTRVAQQATADLTNYRRRVEEEKKNFASYATSNLVLELLQVTDNFDRALQNIPEEIQGSEWIQGIKGIDQQFHAILERQGVKPIETTGQKLDLNLHEAMMTGPGEKDTILEEFERGYMIGDRMLRPAKVKVGDGS
ncbi:nucleotide exchange factor GrpE [Candidatus Peregrinibacteria bacterium]|nr:nucleotide exchange factor GrpE [Candidatus Peregrinibacteria bacterium]